MLKTLRDLLFSKVLTSACLAGLSRHYRLNSTSVHTRRSPGASQNQEARSMQLRVGMLSHLSPVLRNPSQKPSVWESTRRSSDLVYGGRSELKQLAAVANLDLRTHREPVRQPTFGMPLYAGGRVGLGVDRPARGTQQMALNVALTSQHCPATAASSPTSHQTASGRAQYLRHRGRQHQCRTLAATMLRQALARSGGATPPSSSMLRKDERPGPACTGAAVS